MIVETPPSGSVTWGDEIRSPILVRAEEVITRTGYHFLASLRYQQKEVGAAILSLWDVIGVAIWLLFTVIEEKVSRTNEFCLLTNNNILSISFQIFSSCVYL